MILASTEDFIHIYVTTTLASTNHCDPVDVLDSIKITGTEASSTTLDPTDLLECIKITLTLTFINH